MSKTVLIFALLSMMYSSAFAQSNNARTIVPRLYSSLPASLAHNRTTAEPLKITSLCARDEKIIWSCETDNRKTVSICGSKQLDKQRGYLQYRFGRPGHVELEYPQQRQNTQTAFAYFRYTRPRVTYLGLRFKLNEYDYEIYDNSNEEERAGSEAGVTVTPAGNTAKTVDYRCRKPVVHHLIDLEEVVSNTEMTPGGP
ncbi:MAG: hypothetical protein H0X14_01740 [Acidobacteria bacterium]|nr:hypothetical protein [Acidobacteriota bacterium]